MLKCHASRLLTAATLWWGLASVLVSGVEQQDLDLQDELVFLQAAEAAVPGGYVKHGKVPVHLVVSRKLVTASWVKCKLACDSDKGCQGFKFTPMANNHLPLCELLGAQKGSFMKRSFRAKEKVNKKMQKASELVGKAKKVEVKTAKAAMAARKKMQSEKGKAAVTAARQQTVKAELKITKASEKSAKRKRKLINAKLARAKLEVKEIEGKKLGKFSKQEIKLEKKMRKKEKKKEKKLMKSDKAHLKRKEQRTVKRKRAQMLRKTVRAIKRDNKGIDAEKERFQKNSQAAHKEIAGKRSGIKKKIGLIKRLAQVDGEVMSLRKKVVSTQLALKYATDPERLKRLKEKIRNKIKAERSKLKAANHKKRKYERKAKSKKAELTSAKAVAAKRAAKKAKLQRGEAVEKKKISSLEKKASEGKEKMKRMKEKRGKAQQTAEIKAKHSERVKRIAAAKDSNGLRELNTKLSAKKHSLETDVWRLKLSGRLDTMNKAALLRFYAQLGQKEEKLRSGLSLLKTEYQKNEVVDGNYKGLFRRINHSTSTVWLKVKTHNLTGRVTQLEHEILSEKQYGATLKKIQALRDVNSGAALLKQEDDRKKKALAAIALLRTQLNSPDKKLALYRQLKDEEKALKGEGATAMRQRIHAQKAKVARKIIQTQVKQTMKIAKKQMKHDNKLAKYKEFVQDDNIKRSGEEKLQKTLLKQDQRISALNKDIGKLRAGKLLESRKAKRRIARAKKQRSAASMKVASAKQKKSKAVKKVAKAKRKKKKASKKVKKAKKGVKKVKKVGKTVAKAKKDVARAHKLRKKARKKLRKEGKPVPAKMKKGGMKQADKNEKKAAKRSKKAMKKAKKKVSTAKNQKKKAAKKVKSAKQQKKKASKKVKRAKKSKKSAAKKVKRRKKKANKKRGAKYLKKSKSTASRGKKPKGRGGKKGRAGKKPKGRGGKKPKKKKGGKPGYMKSTASSRNKSKKGGKKAKKGRAGKKPKGRAGKKAKKGRAGKKPKGRAGKKPKGRAGKKPKGRAGKKKGGAKKMGGNGAAAASLRKKAVPKGQTCVKKTPVKHASVQKEKDLTKLYNGCKKLAGAAPAFVIYPPEAREAQSNCWKCASTQLRATKMTASYTFTRGGKPAGGKRGAKKSKGGRGGFMKPTASSKAKRKGGRKPAARGGRKPKGRGKPKPKKGGGGGAAVCNGCFKKGQIFCKDGAGYCVAKKGSRKACKNSATLIKRQVGCKSVKRL